MQMRHKTALTSEQYVNQEAWAEARLDVCPAHGSAAGCGFRRLGTYHRTTPEGMEVTRYYCAQAQKTFSLLPDCLAAQLPGDLDEVARVVQTVEAARSVEAAAEALRPDIELASAVRWVRRRLRPVRAVLLALVTLVPDLMGQCAPTLSAVKGQVGHPVLRNVREQADKHLGVLSAPVGFGPRPRRGRRRRTASEHEMGPDPYEPKG